VAGSNWWVNSSPFQGASGGTTVGGGGYAQTADAAIARDPLDAKRIADGLAPGSSYPDGYLGTIIDRRQDRMLGVLQSKLTSKSYQRGVHKGERLGQDSYYWTDEMNPDQGIQRQMATAQMEDIEGGVVMTTQRYTQSGNPVERLAHMGKTAGLTPPEEMRMARQYGVDPAKNPLPMTMTDPTRAARMARSLPRWSGVNQA
jgi:hypothetical protein